MELVPDAMTVVAVVAVVAVVVAPHFAVTVATVVIVVYFAYYIYYYIYTVLLFLYHNNYKNKNKFFNVWTMDNRQFNSSQFIYRIKLKHCTFYSITQTI